MYIRYFFMYLFLSWVTGTIIHAQTSTLNIGLLIPDQQSVAARQGAELAIRQANEAGGYAGKKFNLVTRSVEGLWGAGSKQSVHLIFDDRVLAIIGSLDGRNAHLAEQVATKTKIAYIETYATEMTLSYAFVPWFFRVIPDDRLQAQYLCKTLYASKNYSKILLLGNSNYDSRLALKTFIKVAEEQNVPQPVRFITEDESPATDISSILNKAKPEAVVFFGDPVYVAKMINRIKQTDPSLHLYAPLFSVLNPKPVPINWTELNGLTLISPEYLSTDNGEKFIAAFREQYDYSPGPVSAYAYDAVNMIIQAVRISGPDREKIIETLSKLNFQGITGRIKPDSRGNRSKLPGLILIKNGSPSEILNP